MKFRYLNEIVTIAEAGSFRKAAVKLKISQPALTRSIQNAEALFGVPFFERLPGKVVLTPFGEAIIERGRLILKDVDAIVRDVKTMARLEGGEIRMGIGPHPVEFIKGSVIGEFMRQYPKIRMKLEIDSWINLIKMLLNKTIDLYVGEVVEIDPTESIHIIDLPREKVLWYCRPNHPLLNMKEIHPADLAAFPVIVPSRPPRFDKWLGKIFAETPLVSRSGKLSFALECNHYDVLRATAAVSDCVGALPGSTLFEAFNRGELVELPLPIEMPLSGGGIAYLKNRMLPPATKALIDLIINKFDMDL